MNKRKEKRDLASDRIAREVRYQMVAHGRIAENDRLYQLLIKWMELTGKRKYVRPALKKELPF